MLLVEIIAVVFSLACVILTVRTTIWNWPVGLIGIFAYAILFFNSRLYADFGLQFVFFTQTAFGWWYWLKGDNGEKAKITNIGGKEIIFWGAASIALYLFVVFILKRYTNSDVAMIDSFVSVGSLLANWMLAKKKLESWIIWIVVDVIYIGLFIYKGLYLSSVLYVVFLGLSINGYINWNKKMKYEKI